MISKKINKIMKIADDLKYLSEEYGSNPIRANRDGDVEFSSLVEYLEKDDNVYMIEHIIKVVKYMRTIGE